MFDPELFFAHAYEPGHEDDFHIEPKLCKCGRKPHRNQYTEYSEIWCDCGRYISVLADLRHAAYCWNRDRSVRDKKGRFS